MSELTWRPRVLRWTVPVDDKIHQIGGGKVVHTQSRESGVVEVWTDEKVCDQTAGTDDVPRLVRVFGTGHPLPEDRTHVGSTLDGPFAWHVYEVAPS